MQGILKINEISTVGGTTPQGDGVTIVGQIEDWVVVDVADASISSVQEFNIQPVDDNFAETINGPQFEGAYNAPAFEITSFGDKMTMENNPGQIAVGMEGVEDGFVLESPDVLDDQSQKNFTAEEAKPYNAARAFIKKYDAKSILRNQIRGKIVDVEDDIADTKVASQMALYYFANEWKTRTQAQKNANAAKDSMESLANKLLSDDTKMRADLANGIEAISEIVEKEVAINEFINANYKYTRGV